MSNEYQLSVNNGPDEDVDADISNYAEAMPLHNLEDTNWISVAAFNTSQRPAEEFEKLSKELEDKILQKRSQRNARANYWYLGIVAPLAALVFWTNTHVNEGIFLGEQITNCTIIKRENVSSTAFILTVRPKRGPHMLGKNADPYAEFWDRNCWAVKIVQPELQITRYYTPLPPLDTDRPEELRFLIRKVEEGEVSVYLSRLSVGAKIQIMQPISLVESGPEEMSDVVFLAGGTGIASAMSLAYSSLERKHTGEIPKIHILWASRRREDCLGGGSNSGGRVGEGTARNRIVKELDDLQRKHPANLSVEYVVDEERTAIDENRLWHATRNTPAQSSATSKMLFISGPDGFVDYFAGPKVWEDGQHKQGPLGGLLGRMNLDGWTVRKL